MFPITFENVQKMFQKCSNFRNANFRNGSFEVLNFFNPIKLFLIYFKINYKSLVLIGPGVLIVYGVWRTYYVRDDKIRLQNNQFSSLYI